MFSNIKYLLFPKRCPFCDEVLALERYDAGICPSCKPKIHYALEPVCKICGKVIADENGELCNDCSKKRHFFKQSKGVYVYEGPVKGAMYRFKYNNMRCYVDTFTKDSLRTHERWIRYHNIDAIIPVPMYCSKKRKRGYNQAEVLARGLSKNLNTPMYTDIVVRSRSTAPMKGLSDTMRQKNLKNAFNYVEKGIQLERVLVVDDIYTTGTTLDSVAKVLLDAGVKEVYGLCLCVGRGYS